MATSTDKSSLDISLRVSLGMTPGNAEFVCFCWLQAVGGWANVLAVEPDPSYGMPSSRRSGDQVLRVVHRNLEKNEALPLKELVAQLPFDHQPPAVSGVVDMHLTAGLLIRLDVTTCRFVPGPSETSWTLDLRGTRFWGPDRSRVNALLKEISRLAQLKPLELIEDQGAQ